MSKERHVRSCSLQQYITDTIRTAHSLGNNSAESFPPTCIIVYTHVNAPPPPPPPSLYCLHAGACGLLKPQSLSDQERLACMCLTSIKRPLPFSRCTRAACNDPLFQPWAELCLGRFAPRQRADLLQILQPGQIYSAGEICTKGTHVPIGHDLTLHYDNGVGQGLLGYSDRERERDREGRGGGERERERERERTTSKTVISSASLHHKI